MCCEGIGKLKAFRCSTSCASWVTRDASMIDALDVGRRIGEVITDYHIAVA